MTEVPKLHIWVRELDFLGQFIVVIKRISARNLKNTLKLSQNFVWRSRTMIFEKNVLHKRNMFFLNFSRSSKARAGPIRAHMGPYGSIWALMGPKNPKRYLTNSLY